MITNGEFFNATLEALDFEGDDQQRRDTEANAGNIVQAVMTAYGAPAGGVIDPTSTPTPSPVGLVYGRIQSGKTRAMIASTALAFDNGFRISVVMTSNINDLVTQTHGDFTSGLHGVMTFTKDDDLGREVENVKMQMERGNGRLLIVCSKGAGSLQNVSTFLTNIGAGEYPAIIFDDEGDQASLDTNTARRARGEVAIDPSTINRIIQSNLKGALIRHVYVSVTGTPQAVLLQSVGSTHRASFITMLPPGRSYIGGDHFFSTGEPEDNPDHLIEIVEHDEKDQLLNMDAIVPDGLRHSILFFLVSASAAILTIGPKSKGYAHLSHPSLRNNEQECAETRINVFLAEVASALFEEGETEIERELRAAYENLRTTLGDETPDFADVVETIKKQLATRKILVINAKVKRQGIAYGPGLNFLIGGNTLGRGIAVKNLLVTYYVRDARVSQIDTMHQHARMYGYRLATLKHTRLFIPRHLYYRFRDIHESDTDLRTFIEAHKDQLPGSFPVEYTEELRTTRGNVLDVNNMDALRPRMHVFPNYVIVPQAVRGYEQTIERMRARFGLPTATEHELATAYPDGLEISKDEAIELATGIKTHSKNTWRDKTIAVVIGKVAAHYNDRVLLRFRTANRTVGADGFISTGAVSGDELRTARDGAIPTLWIMSVTTREGGGVPAGERFMYPTFIIPENFPRLFMFNRG